MGIHKIQKWSNLHERCGIGRIERKIIFQILSFHDNSKNENRKNWKNNFSFDSAHCASFIKTGEKLKVGGGFAYP